MSTFTLSIPEPVQSNHAVAHRAKTLAYGNSVDRVLQDIKDHIHFFGIYHIISIFHNSIIDWPSLAIIVCVSIGNTVLAILICQINVYFRQHF